MLTASSGVEPLGNRAGRRPRRRSGFL